MAWNALPDDLRDSSLSTDNFRKKLSVSECTWTLSALEALGNALYKFKTYLLTYLLTDGHVFGARNIEHGRRRRA